MINILKRPPGDDFTFILFSKLVKTLEKFGIPHVGIYTWSPVFDVAQTFLEGPEQKMVDWKYFHNQLESLITPDKLVVLGVKDHLTIKDQVVYDTKMPESVSYLISIFKKFSNNQFILFTSLENLESYITNENVKIVQWGGDLVQHHLSYKILPSVNEKNFDSLYTYVSLNRGQRAHRILNVSLLHGLNIQHHGLISCMFKDGIRGLPNWQFTDDQQHIKELMDNGFNVLKNSTLMINDDHNVWNNHDLNGAGVFKRQLRPHYENTFVDVITETSYLESAFLLTEKFQHSVYGRNFPIYLCSKGAVAFLRDMGFDMFDDVVNHSYDSIDDPIDRLYKAITDNLELLTNNQRTKQLWREREQRFTANIAFARTGMYNFYTARATKQFNEIISTFG